MTEIRITYFQSLERNLMKNCFTLYKKLVTCQKHLRLKFSKISGFFLNMLFLKQLMTRLMGRGQATNVESFFSTAPIEIYFKTAFYALIDSACISSCLRGGFRNSCSDRRYSHTCCQTGAGGTRECACDPGWTGKSCNETCPRGTYGFQCLATAGAEFLL